jgi:aspartate/methionine/tyrosine aminotransferase
MRESLRLQAVQAPIIPVVADWIRARPGTISLGQGVVNYGPPPAAMDQIAPFLADPANHKYQAVVGIPPLLDAIAAKLAAENQIHLGGESRIVVTAGGNMGFLNALLAIADPGDEIILPTPYYFNHEMAVVMANCRPVLVPTDADYQLDLVALRAAITPRTRAIVTVSPNNPTGAVYPATALTAVNRLCFEHGLFHLHDEAYEYFTYDGVTSFSPGSLPGAAAHTISLFSLSKAYGFASWRIGWMVIPVSLEAAVRKIQDTNLICAPVISQHVALAALRVGRNYTTRQAAGTRRRARRRPRQARRRLRLHRAAGRWRILLFHPPRHVLHPVRNRRASRARTRRRRHPRQRLRRHQGCHLRVAYAALPQSAILEGVDRLVGGLRSLL